jgi:hypothetical protein
MEYNIWGKHVGFWFVWTSRTAGKTKQPGFPDAITISQLDFPGCLSRDNPGSSYERAGAKPHKGSA